MNKIEKVSKLSGKLKYSAEANALTVTSYSYRQVVSIPKLMYKISLVPSSIPNNGT